MATTAPTGMALTTDVVDVVKDWLVAGTVEVGKGVAPTVVKLPATQSLVRLIALERTRQ